MASKLISVITIHSFKIKWLMVAILDFHRYVYSGAICHKAANKRSISDKTWLLDLKQNA